MELHITNGITLPYLSFASFQLDLERGFGPDEFHNRFSEEYILTETLGTHTGCAPSVLCCITGNNLDYVTRTFLCYTFAYDLPNVTWQYMGGKDYNKLWRKLYQFGYATKDVEVLTFWENVPHPVTVKDKDTRITVYRKKSNSHTIAAVCDLGNSRRKIEVDISGLNYKNVQVSNWETGKKYSVSPSGTIILDLPRRDFILLEICGK